MAKNNNQQASKSVKDKTSKHKPKPPKKPASISKDAKLIGSLGGRPRKNPYASL